jgi:hypothetical protein
MGVTTLLVAFGLGGAFATGVALAAFDRVGPGVGRCTS